MQGCLVRAHRIPFDSNILDGPFAGRFRLTYHCWATASAFSRIHGPAWTMLREWHIGKQQRLNTIHSPTSLPRLQGIIDAMHEVMLCKVWFSCGIKIFEKLKTKN
jgi:hypothetical protein